MSEYKSRGFLLKQRAVLKLYLMSYIENGTQYGMEMLGLLRDEFHEYGYRPTHSEMYKVLHELTREGSIYREKRLRGTPGIDFQEIILYHLTDKGKDDLDLYKKQIKKELDRCLGLLNKVVRDNY